MDNLTAVTSSDRSTGHSYEGASHADGVRRFRAAARHSRRVRFLRIALPIGAVVAVTGIALSSYFNQLRTLLPKDMGRVVVSGTKITMEQPRLSGFTNDSRAYELTARAAAQDLTQPDVIELKEIRAVVAMADQGKIQVTSPNGVYNSKSEKLNLLDNVVMIATSGYELRLVDASVDVRKGSVLSEKRVDAKFSGGTLTANRLEVSDNGTVIRFGGGVTMNLNNLRSDRAAAQTESQ